MGLLRLLFGGGSDEDPRLIAEAERVVSASRKGQLLGYDAQQVGSSGTDVTVRLYREKGPPGNGHVLYFPAGPDTEELGYRIVKESATITKGRRPSAEDPKPTKRGKLPAGTAERRHAQDWEGSL